MDESFKKTLETPVADPLREDDLRAMLEAREAELEKNRKLLARRTSKVFWISAAVLVVLSLGTSFLIEWYRARHPKSVQRISISDSLGIKPEDAHFGKQLFDFVAPPKPAADKEP